MGMAPFNFDERAPTMVLPPQNQSFFDYKTSAAQSQNTSPQQQYTPSASNPVTPGYFGNNGYAPGPLAHVGLPASSSNTPLTSNPSRKRSRDESSLDESGSGFGLDGSKAAVSIPTPVIPEEEPIYGEGMVLLNPRTGRTISAESQTGTWFEEKAAQDEATRQAAAEAAQRPEFTSRKSQRLDLSAPGLDDIASLRAVSPPKAGPISEPAVDDFTLALGIGWTRVTSSPDMEPAVRGWEKYIDNHFARSAVHNAKILVKSKGLNAYLVRADEGYFLFSDDLNEGQLVGRDWNTASQNLRAVPVTFEAGSVTLKADRSPEPESVNMNGTTTATTTTAPPIAMDMGSSMNDDAIAAGFDEELMEHAIPAYIPRQTAPAVPVSNGGGMDLD